MRPGTKLAINAASGALVWGIIAMAVCWREKPQKRAVRVAQTALHASVDNPESVKVIAVSDPDSVFGRCYIDDEEKMAIAVSMMKVNERVMSQTDNLGSMDFDNPPSGSLSRGRCPLCRPCAPLCRWKARRSPKAVQRLEGQDRVRGRIGKRHSPTAPEYWFITDRDAQCVVSSFEIPLL